MTSSLSELIQKSSHRKPKFSTKATLHWKLIRKSLNLEKDANAENPIILDKQQPKTVGHGIHRLKKVAVDQTIENLVYNPFADHYVVLDWEGNVSVILPSGHKETLSFEEPLLGVVYATKTKQYIGWSNNEKLWLLNDRFKLISSSSATERIHSCVYNNLTHEIVTGGAGNVTCWSFRYGAKYLMVRKANTDCLGEKDIITKLCLEDTRSSNQRCFAVCGHSVYVFNLVEGKCLQHFKDMHTRDITSILFFNPLKFLITGARDGSIKVWDDKGSIQIVFVGHLGCVYTISVYPYGPYIISGSIDNTIRVWSLETCDEVDQIECQDAVLGLGTTLGVDKLYSYSPNSIDLWEIQHVHNLFSTLGSAVKIMKPSTHPKMPLRMVCICSDGCVRLVSPVTGDILVSMLSPDMITIVDCVYSAAEDLLFVLLINGKILKCSTTKNPCPILQCWTKEQTEVPQTCCCLCLYEYVVEDRLDGDKWKDLVTQAKTQADASAADRSGSMTPKPNRNDRNILLGGCIDGTIVVYDWQNKKQPGKISYKVEGHHDEVVSLVANPKIDQVVSAGADNTVKLWRLFPFAEEALAPLMNFSTQEPPRYLSFSHHRLSVAFHEPATATYSLAVYKTTQKERFEHSPDDDHTDDVTGLTSCPKMRLFASCSVDGSIRIWDEANRLLRIIKLNATPSCISFCSERGDLLVSLGEHLHKIDYPTFMPQSYLFRMVAMEFPESFKEDPVPHDEQVINDLSTSDQQRLSKAHSSIFRFTRFADVLSQSEIDKEMEEEISKKQVISQIEAREEELRKLRDGDFKINKKKKKKKSNEGQINPEAFNKYLNLFYKRPDVNIPEHDEMEVSEGPVYVEEEFYSPERQPTGFFSISPRPPPRRKTEEQLSPLKPDKSFKTFSELHEFHGLTQHERDIEFGVGGIPQRPATMATRRDVVMETEKRGLRDIHSAPPRHAQMELLDEESLHRHYIIDVPDTGDYPSPLKPLEVIHRDLSRAITDDEVRPVTRKRTADFMIAPDGYIPNSVAAALFKQYSKQAKEEEEKEMDLASGVPWKPKELTAEQLSQVDGVVKTQVIRQDSTVLTPAEEETIEHKKQEKVEKQQKEKETRKKIFDEQLKQALRDVPSPEDEEEDEDDLNARELLESLLKTPPSTPPKSPAPPEPEEPPKEERPVKPLKPIEKLVSRPKPPTPTPPPPKEPTPTPPPPPPPPTPLPEFIEQFRGTVWFDTFFPDLSSSTFPKPWTMDAFVEILLQCMRKTPEYELKIQICAALMVLNRQETLDREIAEMINMTLISQLNAPSPPQANTLPIEKQFIRIALQVLQTMRIFDHSYIAELMAQYIDGDEEIRDLCLEVLVTLGVMDPHGYFIREMDTFDIWDVPENRRKTKIRELCMQWVSKWLHMFQEHIRTLARKITRARSGTVVRGTKSPKTPSSLKGILRPPDPKEKQDPASKSGVSFPPEALGAKAADSATPVEAINYFCEMTMQEEIERARAPPPRPKPKPKQQNARNTVLILPKLHTKPSLARLGETHCSQCHPERETGLSLAFPLPPIYQTKGGTFIHNVSLHLNTLTLNPFPGEDDYDLYETPQRSNLLTLRSQQKYFIPSKSYVPPDFLEALAIVNN